MREFMKRISLFVVAAAVVGLLVGTVHAEAAVKWVFSTSNGQKKANVNKTIAMEKGEYQDMNLYRNGKQIKEKNAEYTVKWYSSDTNVVYIDKASGKMKADKYGKMKKDTGSAKITAVITNKKTGTTAKKSFTVKVKAAPVPEIKETPASAFEYEIINKEVNIVRLADRTLQEVWIPEKIDGYPVTGIEKEAFYYCSDLVSIEIPVSVKRIGENAFIGTPWLEQAKLDNQYLIFGDGILYWVSPEAEGVFAIPQNVKRIGAGAFQDSNITGVKIPNSVTEIGAQAFQWCRNLVDIVIPSSVTRIGEDALLGTAWLKQQEETKTFLVLGDGVLTWVSRKTEGAFVVPKNVKSIGGGAFKWCDKITSIEIPSGVVSIGESAFYDCKKLTSVNIPSGVTEIANYAFYGCTSLAEVKLPDTVTKIGDNAFDQCGKLEAIKIPSGVTSIGDYAFNWCSSLSNIEIPSGVKSISYSAFNWTPWLTQQKQDNTLLILGDGILYWASDEISGELVIPSNVKTIAWSFSYTGLTKVVVPEGVTSIKGGTFEYCYNLESVKLPSSIVEIGQRAFSGCSKLTDIVIPEGVKSIGEEAFASCSGLTGIKLPAGLSSVKRGMFQYCKSLTKVEIPSSVRSIEADAFRSCGALTKVTIRNGVISIGSEAFAYCTGLKTMAIPSSVESIGDNAFYNTAWLDNQKKSQNYLVLGDGILYWVSTDTKGTFVVPDGVKLIAGNAVADCNKITEVKLPDSVKTIGDKAFFNCTALKKLVLPSGVKEIGARAFYNCEKLAAINVDKVSSIGYGAFVNCKSLSKIELPMGITRIHGSVWSMTGEDDCSGMFAGCSKLESIVIPEGVMEIGESAFANCINLKSIRLPESLLRISANAFNGCSSLESIYIPKNVEYFERDLPRVEQSGGDGASMYSNTKRMRECASLKEIVVDEGNKYYASIDGVLFNKEKTILLGVPDGYKVTSYQVPSGTLMIADAAFLNCKNIKTITVPESVQRIEEDAFDRCDSLTKITFLGNNKIYSFKDNALYENLFSRWGDLVQVELVRVFGANVTEMYVPEDVTLIGSDAFQNCKNLKSIRVSESNEKYASVDGILYSKDKTEIVAIPPKYEKLVILANVDVSSALFYAVGLKEVVLADGITSLPYEVTGIPDLEKLHIPATVDWLDDYDSFYLKNVTIYAPSGSEAEAWAKRNGLTFVEE